MSWKCNFSIYFDIPVYYLDIQAITTLYAFYWFVVLFPSIYSFFYLATALLKVTFSGTQKPTPPTVFSLQASNWVHCEEKTGAYYQLSRFTFKLLFFYKFLKLFILPKKHTFQKISKNVLFIFFQKEIIGHTYICTKCIDNFKFTIYLKSYEE